jgi:hypothetical protein
LTVSVVSVGVAGCNGARRLEKEDASAQGALVNSTHPCSSLGCYYYYFFSLLLKVLLMGTSFSFVILIMDSESFVISIVAWLRIILISSCLCYISLM